MAQDLAAREIPYPTAEKNLVLRAYGHARALVRLAVFMTLSVWWITRLAFKASWVGYSRKLAAEYCRRWAIHAASVLGLKIVTIGRLPEGAYLLVANHRSYIDIAAAAAQGRMTFVARSDMARWPVLGWGARITNTVFVTRDSRESRKQTRIDILNVIQSGDPVIVFPEGTTALGPNILPFRPGNFLSAAEFGVAVVPIAIHYADPSDAWVGDDAFVSHFLRQFAKPEMRVTVAIGDPIRDTDGERLRSAAEEWVRQTILSISTGGPHAAHSA